MNLPPLPTTGVIQVGATYTPLYLFTAEQMQNYARLAVQMSQERKPVQVTPLQFVEMVFEKEDCVGVPLFWAQWPNEGGEE